MSARSMPAAEAAPAAALARAFRQVGIPALRVLALLAPIAMMGFAVTMWPIFGHPTAIGTDASNYFAAGLRLNAGHQLYALVAGDRDVPLSPPYWTVPLLAPPPIAVAWRVLALAGESSMVAWWVASILLALGTTLLLARRGGIAVLTGLVLVSPGIAFAAVSGNANSFLLPALVAAWFVRDRHPAASGALVAVAAAVKLSPALLLVWLVLRPATAARRGLAGFVAAGAVIAAVSAVGAGLDANFDYLRVLRLSGNGAPTDMSLPALATAFGLPASLQGWVIPIVVVIAIAAAVALRRRERVAFAILAAAGAMATPAVSFSTFALLAVALAPFVDGHGLPGGAEKQSSGRWNASWLPFGGPRPASPTAR